MRDFLQNLSREFINEAQSSPRMFEDLAAMEHYMAESYDGRAFIEIMQNADDAGATSIVTFTAGNDIVIANNGRSFTQEDLLAICRSGASSKRRGSGIGYRGIGFKSSTSLSTEIIIYSSGVFFSFSKTRCAKELNKDVTQVPTVRIPFLVEDNQIEIELRQRILAYESQGYSTFFIFKDGSKEKLSDELQDISSGWLIFLNHIENVDIDFSGVIKKITVQRSTRPNNYQLFTDKTNKQQWIVASGKNNSAVAFKYDHGIIPCASEEAVFHCYLPTIDSLGFPFKVNADFSTDPSRKHIIINDDESKHCFSQLADLIVETISLNSNSHEQAQIINLFCSYVGMSEASSFLEKQIFMRLKTNRWIPLMNGQQAIPIEHRMIPSWFDSESTRTIFNSIKHLQDDELSSEVTMNVPRINELLLKCGSQYYDTKEYSTILSNLETVADLSDAFLGKLWAYTLRMTLFLKDQVESLFIKDEAGRIRSISNITGQIQLSDQFLSAMSGILSDEELLKARNLLSFDELPSPEKEKKKKTATSKSFGAQQTANYSKWKTPIQNCIVAERLIGRTAQDVSRKKLGYDIESIDSTGRKRLLVVKAVESLGNAFVFSESEYECAERNNADFGIYVIETNNPENNMLIEDINSISFEKRVKEWEWVSGAYEIVQTEKNTSHKEIDSKFLKAFSLEYLNSVQIALLKVLCENENINDFEAKYGCKSTSIVTQINGICDFYVGDTLIESSFQIKPKYMGSIEYLLAQNEKV